MKPQCSIFNPLNNEDWILNIEYCEARGVFHPPEIKPVGVWNRDKKRAAVARGPWGCVNA